MATAKHTITLVLPKRAIAVRHIERNPQQAYSLLVQEKNSTLSEGPYAGDIVISTPLGASDSDAESCPASDERIN
jgi:hypothetical protein